MVKHQSYHNLREVFFLFFFTVIKLRRIPLVYREVLFPCIILKDTVASTSPMAGVCFLFFYFILVYKPRRQSSKLDLYLKEENSFLTRT